MKLEKINLQNFRSYSKRSFDLDKATIVIGENGVGKSNLLEAIYLVATGKSFHADGDAEMISHDSHHSTITASLSDEVTIRVTLTDGSLAVPRKRFEINGVPRRIIDVVGKFRAVLFTPQDLELITGSPSLRRKYLDFVISQKDREYHRNLISYEKGIRQRNKLLEAIREGMAVRSQLFFWDKLIIKNGNYITDSRGNYLSQLKHEDYSVVYDKSDVSETRLKQYEQEEVAAAATLVGPHRDDFTIDFNGRDVSKYGSRGQQRMAVLWLKQGELKYLNSDVVPALLLDDIFSELDHRHRQEVISLVEKHIDLGGQIIMTSADEHLIPDIHATKIYL